jgi:hypothetical protein
MPAPISHSCFQYPQQLHICRATTITAETLQTTLTDAVNLYSSFLECCERFLDVLDLHNLHLCTNFRLQIRSLQFVHQSTQSRACRTLTLSGASQFNHYTPSSKLENSVAGVPALLSIQASVDQDCCTQHFNANRTIIFQLTIDPIRKRVYLRSFSGHLL